MSINKKVPLIILTLVFISLIFTSGFMYMASSKVVLEKGEVELHTYTKEVGKFIIKTIEDNTVRVKLISKNTVFKDLIKHRQSFPQDITNTTYYDSNENELLRKANSVLVNSKEELKEVENMYLLDKEGTVIAHHNESFYGQNFAHESYFKEVIKTGEDAIGDMIISKIDKAKLLVFAEPIIENNEIIGMLCQAVSVNSLNEMLVNTKIGDKGYCYVLDPTGRILIHPNDEIVGTENEIEVLNKTASEGSKSTGINDMKTRFAEFEYDKKDMLMTYTVIPKTNWTLAITNEVKDFRKPADDMLFSIMKFLIVIMIVSGVSSIVVSKKITDPINNLNKFIKNMATGNLSITLESHTGDEFDILAANINQMGSNFKELIQEIDKGAKELNATSDILKESIRETSASLDRTSDSVHNISLSIDEQAKNTEIVESMTRNLGSYVDVIKKNNISIKSIYGDLKRLSMQGDVASRSSGMKESIDSVVRKIEQTSSQMEDLSSVYGGKGSTDEMIRRMSSSQEEIVSSITEIRNTIELQSEIMKDLLEIAEFTSGLSSKLTKGISVFKI